MIAKELEIILHNAFVEARSRRHEYISVEHLMLAVLGNELLVAELSALGLNLEDLRSDLGRIIEKVIPISDEKGDADTQPTTQFQRAIQRAIFDVQSSGRSLVTSADVLLALLNDKSMVALFEKRGATRLQVLAAAGELRSAADKYVASPKQASPRWVELPESQPPRDGSPPRDASDLQVVLYNDDETPMQFVVDVLQKFFAMSKDDAVEVMLEVHREGVAMCGLYARNEAIALIEQVLAYSRRHGHPLRCGWVVPE
jgi:ATP-dependent Clp protease adapter protein ClpS